MKTSEDLRKLLQEINHRSYPAYKGTKGQYQFGKYLLGIDHVQGDPFAAPSRLSIRVKGRTAGFPQDCYQEKHRRIAFADYLLRCFGKEIQSYSFQAKGSGKSGLISITRCRQEVLERTACQVRPDDGEILLRFEVGFPARGRTIQSDELVRILFDFIPKCVDKALLFRTADKKRLERVLFLADDYTFLQSGLKERGLVAFIANGSILPRESGISSRPMKDGIPFHTPDAMKVTIELPHKGVVEGMGIPEGITLIVGGGYHGKSTLLKALEAGVYPHIEGDGREYVATEASAVKIRSEDGRSIRGTDISMFIGELPNGKDTRSFYTEDASGSTSQAANITESIEAGTRLLLIDEDTSATNLMVRDELMQQVIQREMEPITPFIERVRSLYQTHGISSILVAGSSGSYFQVADEVIQMDKYEPIHITAMAKEKAAAYPGLEIPEDCPSISYSERKVFPDRKLNAGDRIKQKVQGLDSICINHEVIDMRYVEQLKDPEQLQALGQILLYMERSVFNGKKSLHQSVEETWAILEREGFSGLLGHALPGNLAMPRKQEIYACLNRYRPLEIR
ncbi:ABC-ATPase domain-containing protein [Clostridiaceae bacterium 68-1-5]|uniref:ABC-ATPase domain-containing protein n=1 Tax=Suipraeoptans intestinalis TaxID=2606628 RepID=A0A6N7URA0_9FIRM|nr:ABC-ATPase domain-containing protein [Suipraeoptans intestinalis]